MTDTMTTNVTDAPTTTPKKLDDAIVNKENEILSKEHTRSANCEAKDQEAAPTTTDKTSAAPAKTSEVDIKEDSSVDSKAAAEIEDEPQKKNSEKAVPTTTDEASASPAPTSEADIEKDFSVDNKTAAEINDESSKKAAPATTDKNSATPATTSEADIKKDSNVDMKAAAENDDESPKKKARSE